MRHVRRYDDKIAVAVPPRHVAAFLARRHRDGSREDEVELPAAVDVTRAQDARVADQNVEAKAAGLQIMHLAARVAHDRWHAHEAMADGRRIKVRLHLCRNVVE